MIEDIWAHGQRESLREDLQLRAALDRLAAEVKPIAPEQHAAREAIWTPDKEKPAGETKLWTPGSEESPMSPLIPMVIEQTSRGERSFDIYSPPAQRTDHLPRDAGGRPDRQPDHRAAPPPRVEDPDKDIDLYINSPGGHVYAGLAIYDTMQFIKPDVRTICVGIAMNMGAVLLAGGAKGKRMACRTRRSSPPGVGWLPGSGVRHRDPREGDDRAEAKARGDRLAPHEAGRGKVRKDMDRDFFMTSEESVEYGIIDQCMPLNPGTPER